MKPFKWYDGDAKPQTFDGFQHYIPDSDSMLWLVIATGNGEEDYWLVDGRHGLEELMRFYRMSRQHEPHIEVFVRAPLVQE
jgi:hypothetical protein